MADLAAMPPLPRCGASCHKAGNFKKGRFFVCHCFGFLGLPQQHLVLGPRSSRMALPRVELRCRVPQ
eukprot:10286031-Alexandrium_andersonii.AAC.1